jgi:signal transduction histidine kinase
VTQLLELSRAENGTLPKEDLDLSNLVTGEALPFESIAFEQGLSLESNIEEGIHIQGNAGQLRQLTAILIDNAISHSQGGDSVDISLKTDRHQAVLSVTNYGPEIPKDVRDKLFERFYRTDEARTGGSGHYGLGLAIARAIVQGHSGVISVDCADGKVTFKAALPMNN